MPERLLQARGLHTYYGASHVLRGIDFHVERSASTSVRNSR